MAVAKFSGVRRRMGPEKEGRIAGIVRATTDERRCDVGTLIVMVPTEGVEPTHS